MTPVTRILILIVIMVTAMLYRKISDILNAAPAPNLPLDQWWGDGEAPKDWAEYLANNSDVVNNRLVFKPETIDDVTKQLNRTVLLPEPLEGINFEYGFNSNYLKELVEYWRDDYMPRWRSREVFLWQFNQFTTNIQGLRMHFMHLMSWEDNIKDKIHYPVLLLHGWPGSFREFYALMKKLHDPTEDKEYVFNVVVPSIPGYAWSQGTSKPGLGAAEVAVIMHNLMARLGYDKYFIQGGDWGSVIGSHMATLFPESVLGYHSNMCSVLSPKAQLKGLFASLLPSLFAPKGFEDFFFPQSNKFQYLIEESGYFHLQATKPDTIGSVLTDNPIGLAAYILEKFSTWTNGGYRQVADGGFKKRFKMDALLDNVMIYHLTNSITTSQRLYAESFSSRELELRMDRVPTYVPTGCARFKHDIMHTLDFQLKDKYRNLIHSTYYREGGHFAALEVPNTLYLDFIEFVKKVEKLKKHVK